MTDCARLLQVSTKYHRSRSAVDLPLFRSIVQSRIDHFDAPRAVYR
jgi:hypothetical protein